MTDADRPDPSAAGVEPDVDAVDADRDDPDGDDPGVDEPEVGESDVDGSEAELHTTPSISGVDIREIDLSDMAEVEKLFGLSPLTRPTSTDPRPTAELPAVVRNADSMAALYAAGAAPEEETWDGRYRGRRRARMMQPRFWLAGVAVFATIGAAIYLMMLPPAPGRGVAEPSEPGAGSAPAVAVGPTRSASAAMSPTPNPTSPKPASSPTPKPTTGAPPPPPPAFEPLTVEAEAGTRGGSAEQVPNGNASGDQIVQQMGNWGASAGPGTLTIGIEVPTKGTYSMTISYLHPDGESTRSAVITVNSVASPPTTFTVTDGNCCYTLTLPLTLKAGANTIVFANATGHAPALDKFVITRPD